MQALTHRWRPFTSAVALGLVLGVLLTPIGMAHLAPGADVCDAPSQRRRTGEVRVLPVTEFGLHDHCLPATGSRVSVSTLLASGVVPVDANEACLLPRPLPSESSPSRGPRFLPAPARLRRLAPPLPVFVAAADRGAAVLRRGSGREKRAARGTHQQQKRAEGLAED